MSRYIDADRLAEKKFIAVELIGYGENVAYRVGWNDAIDAIIENEPTIDAVSVVHGEWIKHDGRTIVNDNNFIDFFPTEYECSNCGYKESMYFINSKPHNFCPNCGADMRKGASDEIVSR